MHPQPSSSSRDLRLRKEALARAIAEKRLREERRRQADLGSSLLTPGEHGGVLRPGGLIHFVRYFWHVLEPSRPLVEGWPLEAICLHLEAITRGDIRRLLVNVPPGFMKALCDDTPIFTTWGWKRHGDLKPGDFVFGPDGAPKRVLAVTAPWVAPVFDVRFDDGNSIIAAADHLWAIERDVMSAAPKYRRGRKAMVVRTDELRTSDPQNGWTRRPDRIQVAAPVAMPPKRFLVDPYVLGVWLGDGATDGGNFGIGEGDIEHFEKLGRISNTYEPTGSRKQRFYRITVEGLQEKLRILGLLGNKHIPDDYLEGSIEQRLALLQGLMDTDGCATKPGSCNFTTKRPHLAEQVRRLCQSLGLKCHVNENYSYLNGQKFGPYFTVNFTAPEGFVPFRLARKQKKVKPNQNGRSRHRYVTAVDPLPARSVRCIQVEGGLYLAGRAFIPTHNSMLVNCLWPAWEWTAAGLPSTRYVTFAYAAHLTQRDNTRFRDLLLSPEMQELWGDTSELFRQTYGEPIRLTEDGKIKPVNSATGFKFASSVGGVSTGERGDRIICDDLHNVKEQESEAVRTETVRWTREAMPNRLNDMVQGAIVGIGQRVHEEDASNAMLEDGDYVHLMIPMELDPERRCSTAIGWVDPRTYEGELAWPERFPISVVSKLKRTLGPTAYSAQYQQAPQPRGGAIFKRDWWGAYELAIGARPRHRSVLRVASLDPAFTAKQENDPSGFTVWDVYTDDKRDRKILLIQAWQKWLELHGTMVEQLPGEKNKDYVRRASPHWGLVEWVAYECRRLNVHVLLIENKASGHSVAQEMRRLYGDSNWMTHLIDPGAQDKRARAFSVQHIFAAGMVEAPASVDPSNPDVLLYREFAQMVIDEFAKFRGLPGEEDNLVDSGVQAIRWLRDRGVARLREERELEEELRARHKPQAEALYPV